MRTYELVIVVDPRLGDDEVVALTEDYKKMIAAGGAEITKEESWGRRKLAYPIQKMNEAKYVLLGVKTNGKNPLPEVEHRLRQNDKVLRYLTVRTDTDNPPRPGARTEPEQRPGERPGPAAFGERRERSDRGERGDRGDRGERPDRGWGHRGPREEV
jgi:small subunit ribosomal protein S6